MKPSRSLNPNNILTSEAASTELMDIAGTDTSDRRSQELTRGHDDPQEGVFVKNGFAISR
jgi:hypothetical protein